MNTGKLNVLPYYFYLFFIILFSSNSLLASTTKDFNKHAENVDLVNLVEDIEVHQALIECGTYRFTPLIHPNDVGQIFWIINGPNGSQNQIFGVFDPVYQFSETGQHTVTVYLNNSVCSFNINVNCAICDNASFDIQYLGSGCLVRFQNPNSEGASTYEWDFGACGTFTGFVPPDIDFSTCGGTGEYTATLRTYNQQGEQIGECSRQISTDCGTPSHCEGITSEEIDCGKYLFTYPVFEDDDQLIWEFEHIATGTQNTMVDTEDGEMCFTFSEEGLHRVILLYNNLVPCTLFVDVTCVTCPDVSFDIFATGCFVTTQNVVAPQGAAFYSWDFDCLGTFTGFAQSHNYAPCGSGNYNVTLTVFDINENELGSCTQNFEVECEPLPCLAEIDVEYCYTLNPFTCNPCGNDAGYFCPVVIINGVRTQLDMATGYSVVWTNFPNYLNNVSNDGCMDYTPSVEIDAIENGNPNVYTGVVTGPDGCEYPFEHTMLLEDLECQDCDEHVQAVVYHNICPDPELGCDPCEIGGSICLLSGGQPTDPNTYSLRVFFNNMPSIVVDGSTCYTFGSEASNIIGVQYFNNETLCQRWLSVSISCDTDENLTGSPNSSSETISIFPNPTSSILQVYNQGDKLLFGNLHSIDGRLMKVFDLEAYETEKIIVQNITNGIYFLKIINPVSKEIIRTEKVIISH